MEFCPFLCSPLTYIHPTAYGSYLAFQLFSHKTLYDDSNKDVSKSTAYSPRRTIKQVFNDRAEKKARKNGTWKEPEPIAETSGDVEAHAAETQNEDDKPEMPKMSVTTTIALLVAWLHLVLVRVIYIYIYIYMHASYRGPGRIF